jgi:VanZ family protein
VVAYAALIFTSSSSSDAAPPSRVPDKVVHAGAYAVLSGLIVWAQVAGRWRRVTRRTVVIAVVASVLYGWSDEVHQRFVPGRTYDLLDLAADAVGATAAAGALWAWGIISRGSTRHHGV